ncbi:MAG: NAD(P)-dependent oxidoreductase [Pseudomonadales bacterium]|nr:NAD(P)-dependent oxidoreductase [Pseudomonadales bacterium]
MPTISFVGLGAMGLPMATNLVNAGFQVYGSDLSSEQAQRFKNSGGKAFNNLATAFLNSDFVITMLPNSKIVRSVLQDNSEQLKALSSSKPVVIDMSSCNPIETRTLASDLSKLNIRLIDAPVSGGVKRALSGELAIMAGGMKSNDDEVEKVLFALGNIVKTGAVGSGHAMKALNNFVSAAGLVAACEAINLGKDFGLDPSDIVSVLNTSSGKNNATENKLAQFVLSENYNSGFALRLMAKDLDIAKQLSNAKETDNTLLTLMQHYWQEAAHNLPDNADHTEIMKYIQFKAS